MIFSTQEAAVSKKAKDFSLSCDDEPSKPKICLNLIGKSTSDDVMSYSIVGKKTEAMNAGLRSQLGADVDPEGMKAPLHSFDEILKKIVPAEPVKKPSRKTPSPTVSRKQPEPERQPISIKYELVDPKLVVFRFNGKEAKFRKDDTRKFHELPADKPIPENPWTIWRAKSPDFSRYLPRKELINPSASQEPGPPLECSLSRRGAPDIRRQLSRKSPAIDSYFEPGMYFRDLQKPKDKVFPFFKSQGRK
jgi:hypothetical protein